MEGLNEDWIQAGNRNFATYTHLDPGTYVFRVKGSNSVNVWNEGGTSLAVVIAPPYWNTWWFRLLVVAMVLGLAYAAYRYKLRKALEMERMRLSIADDLHDDVGSSLSTIAMVSRVVQRAPELTMATRGRVAEIFETAIKTSEGMKDIVWFIKPKDDTIDDLLLRMKDTASSILSDVGHEFRTPGKGSTTLVTVEFKRNFFLSFKEVLANIVKHAAATKVRIQIERQADFLEAVIEDDGRGFDQDTARRGNGLGSLQRRAKSMGGKCEIRSSPGKGTTVKFSGRI
jgi:signal transduction histidine kinase